MTKIDIVSGFLGAGKTTLIKKLLSEAFQGEKLVLIENEFGEIGIDGGFLKDAGVQITEMNSGCICCSLVGDFGTALAEVLDTYHPDRIIIEPSGVGKLSDVIKAVKDLHNDEILLNRIVAVADAGKCKMYMKNFGEFFNNQIENAGTIVLSRTQKISEDKLNACIAMIREKNNQATIITTPWDEIDGKQILDAMEKRQDLVKELMEEEHHHHHEEGEECPVCGGHHHDHEHEHHHHDGEECHHHDHDHEEHEHHHHDGEECHCHDHDHEEHEHHHHDGGECHHHDHEHEHHHHDSEECHCHDHEHGHHHHHADEVFTSWGVETPRKYTEEEIKSALEKLSSSEEYGIILRAKGILPSADGEWIYFDMVPEEYEIRRGNADVTGKLCVIGSKLDEAKIKELFYV